ncbi:oxidoreductase [Prosthecomicrobium sp. N25]|uniref:oxidoreductase n=1 Tax=Prosthecomicrobium sp. N25 TaxID=3129254 RepID=UPI003076EA69
MTAPRTDPLLLPLDLGPLRLRNRILSTAHAPSLAEGGHPRDRYRAYHVEKARGGVALTIIGGSTNVSPDSRSVFGQLYAGDDSVVPRFRQLTEEVKAEGAAVMCQLTHMGRRTVWDDGGWLPVIGPSPTRERAHRAIPKAMEEAEIARVTRDFEAAAIRCSAAGFDGIEILAHGHLLGQFLSPLVNRRDDAWGGDLGNRARFLLEVVGRVREAIGPDLALGVRMTGDERAEGGLTPADCVEIARLLERTGALSFLDVIAGAPYDHLGLAAWVPPMGMQNLGHLESAAAIRAAVSLPVFVAGGVNDLATARFALTEGAADMVGMTRSQIADPWLVAKLQAGQEDRIRPCVGLGYCVDRVNKGRAAVCGHNVAAGRERTIPHLVNSEAELGTAKPSLSERRPRTVVVGGGPAGMEAARVAALRGQEVHLFEATPQLGGQLLLAAQSQTRRQIRSVAVWLEARSREQAYPSGSTPMPRPRTSSR